jgi:hypothetical protein
MASSRQKRSEHPDQVVDAARHVVPEVSLIHPANEIPWRVGRAKAAEENSWSVVPKYESRLGAIFANEEMRLRRPRKQ